MKEFQRKAGTLLRMSAMRYSSTSQHNGETRFATGAPAGISLVIEPRKGYNCTVSQAFASVKRRIGAGRAMNEAYIYSFTEPINPEALHMLLRQTEWANARSPLDIQRMLDHSHFTLGVWDEERLIAFARVITDDCYRALIDDVVVDAAYRGRGIASTMLDKLLKRCQHIEQVMLDCAPELCGFYAQFGFRDKGWASMVLENNA